MAMKKVFVLAVGAAAMVAGTGVSPAMSAQVTLRGVSCFAIGSPPSRAFEKLVKTVNARGKGVIQIKMIGGGAAVGSPFTLTQKTAKGVYDVVGCTEGYFGNVLPEADVLRLSDHPFATLRKNGGLAYMQKLLGAKGLHYVARHEDHGPFHLWLNKNISKPNLTGLNLRVSPVYTPFFRSLGATTLRSKMGQIYTLMENNTVQGFGWPAMAWLPAWIKVTKYRVDPGFYNAALHTLVNRKKWMKLNAAQKAIISKVGLEMEANSETTSDVFKAKRAKQMAWYASKGMKTITFTGADRKKWLTAAKDAAWAQVMKRSPKHGPALMKAFRKN